MSQHTVFLQESLEGFKSTTRKLDIKAGDPLVYHPILEDPLSFKGVAFGPPWLLGGHTWVVTLAGMEPEYAKWRGFITYKVHAAHLSHVERDTKLE